MTTRHIQFNDQGPYDFVAELLSKQARLPFPLALKPEVLTIEVEISTLSRLIERVAVGKATVLPYRGRGRDAWIIVGPGRREIEHVAARAGRFIVPTYAEHSPLGSAPTVQLFRANGNRLQQLGAALYGEGYYSWQSPPALFEKIFERLDLWMLIESQQPTLHAERRPTYRELYERFNTALSAASWGDAEDSLSEMRRLGMISADNLAFLEIQLLAQQQNWFVIWQRPDFSTLARLRMPRVVRAALLTAFHQSVLLPHEQRTDWQASVEAFSRSRAMLGLLLTARFDLAYEPIVLVFAYQALLDGDRASLESLRRPDLSGEVQATLDALISMLPEVAPEPLSQLSAEDRTRSAMADANYDAAAQAVEQVAEPAARTLAYLQIAFQSLDMQLAEHALLAYWDLPSETQNELQRIDPRTHLYVSFAEQLIAPGTADSVIEPRTIGTWLEWFDLALREPENASLPSTMDRLAVATDDRTWTIEDVVALNERMLTMITSPEIAGRSYARAALRHHVNYFLQEREFPREEVAYVEFYETLYIGLLESREINFPNSMMLLRLAEAQLRHRPASRDPIWRHLCGWFDEPIAALESTAIELLDLLAEYGLQGTLLSPWYRRWVEHLLGLPGTRERSNIDGWLSFARWVQPGADLVGRLGQLRDQAAHHEDDPVTLLPAGYRIGIFTLRPQSAARVREQLLARNASLDVRICTEVDLSDSARSLAQSVQLPVIVTTCISHALTYGIGPNLRAEPVYPQASGATSILRAIEGRLRRTIQG